MNRDLNALTALVYRQLKRWAVSRSRIISTIIQPLLWIVFLGLGFGAVFSAQNIDLSSIIGDSSVAKHINPSDVRIVLSRYFTTAFGGVDYITFLVTGMAAMTAFIGSFISGISVIWDKQFGFLKETLVAPASRKAIILGRIIGDSIINTVQSLIIILLALLITSQINPWGIPIALLYIFLMSLGFTSVGVAISLKFSSMEGFQMIVNLLTMPLMFLSGAFYPINTMPNWMKAAAIINPLTYCVYGTRYWLAGVEIRLSFMNPITSLIILTIFTIAFTTIAMVLFDKATIEE
ncbi:MAG: ABC transporter [Desulfurococcales archaeon ex4484_217_2]|nr:MAG: ABC transporter [Desulfurococcales archaeon ex4484_217_2]